MLMTIDVRRDPGRYFSITGDRLVEVLTALNYLESLAADSGFDCSTWNISGLVALCGWHNSGHRQAPDKVAIQKYFNQEKKNHKEEAFCPKALHHETESTLSSLYASYSKRDKGMVQGEIAQSRHNMRENEEALEQNKAAIFLYERILASIDDKKEDPKVFVSAIEELLAKGWYRYFRLDSSNKTVAFLTPPIFVHHRLAKAGVDMVVPLGEMKVTLRLTDWALSVSPYKNNTVISARYITPHVALNAFNGICWGNASHLSKEYRFKHELVKYLELLAVVLCTYGDSPYVRLDIFLEEQQRKLNSQQPGAHVEGLPGVPLQVTVSFDGPSRPGFDDDGGHAALVRELVRETATYNRTAYSTPPGGWD